MSESSVTPGAVNDAPPDEGAHCPECGSDLGFCQPDPGRADCLVATCEGCGGWFLATDRRRTLVRLPVPEPSQE